MEVSSQELSQHDTDSDAWIAVNGIVWDVTGFAERHPGGKDVIRENYGADASAIYNDVHSPSLISKHLGDEKRRGNLANQNGQGAELERVSSVQKYEKPPLETMVNLYDFEEVARHSFSEKSWAYVSGATHDCLTVEANQNWYRDILFRPRVLRDVGGCDTGCTLFGSKFGMPIFNAPAALFMSAHPEGEVALAKAAVSAGVTVMVPMLSSYSTDEIIAAIPQGHPWFYQLYVHQDRQQTLKVLKEVCALKPTAILVTVDLAAFPKRESKIRVLIKESLNKPKKTNPAPATSAQPLADNLVWEDIRWIKEVSGLPVVAKGIQCASDARLAYENGCAGIYLSNHGGRALDTAQPGILTLLELQASCPEVLEKMEVILDGGIRRGTDVLKAICLGASAVCVGRPMFYALNYGTAGVERAFKSK
jgi:L-lactate dehydrogenase (cytochrome)